MPGGCPRGGPTCAGGGGGGGGSPRRSPGALTATATRLRGGHSAPPTTVQQPRGPRRVPGHEKFLFGFLSLEKRKHKKGKAECPRSALPPTGSGRRPETSSGLQPAGDGHRPAVQTPGLSAAGRTLKLQCVARLVSLVTSSSCPRI